MYIYRSFEFGGFRIEGFEFGGFRIEGFVFLAKI